MTVTLDLQHNDAVIVPDGRVGMIHTIRRSVGHVVVQFGADGPFKSYKPGSLRWATRDEVRSVGLEGVGGLTVRIK